VAGGHSAQQQHVKQLDSLYHEGSAVDTCWPGQDPVAAAVLAQLPTLQHQHLLTTQFHKREKSTQASISDW
jgi:hypothetical protein